MQLSDVTWQSKAVLSSILNFSRKTGKCTARNSTIAESLNISTYSVDHEISKLAKQGYLQTTGRGLNRDLTVHLQKLQNSFAESAELPKEDKREDKREDKGEIMSLRDNPPHGDLKNGGLKNDQERDEADTEQLLSDFWKQELGL